MAGLPGGFNQKAPLDDSSILNTERNWIGFPSGRGSVKAIKQSGAGQMFRAAFVEILNELFAEKLN